MALKELGFLDKGVGAENATPRLPAFVPPLMGGSAPDFLSQRCPVLLQDEAKG